MESRGGEGIGPGKEDAIPFLMVKHSAAIHMANCLNILERRIYNVLLLQARPQMARGVDHEIETVALENAVHSTRNNRAHLIASVEGLRDKRVRYNIFDKDSLHAEVWRMNSGLVAEIGFNTSRTRCRYSFPNSLVDLLHNPNLFARINLDVEMKLKCVHSVPLYEFYIDILGGYQNEREFAFKIDDVRALLDLGDGYDDFKILNRDVLKRANQEINDKSDIEVGTIALNRIGRNVTSVQISIRRKVPQTRREDNELKDPLHDDPSQVESATIREGEGDGIDECKFLDSPLTTRDQLKKDLHRYLPNSDLNTVLANHSIPYIHANFMYVCRMEKQGKVKNRAAYFLTALKKNYAQYSTPNTFSPPKTVDLKKGSSKGLATPLQRVRTDFDARPAADKEDLYRDFEKSPEYVSLRKLHPNITRESPFYLGQLFNFLVVHAQSYEKINS